jgi:hypothetical protein
MFQEIDAPHARVHDLGKQAISAYNAGDKIKAARLCEEMVSTRSFCWGYSTSWRRTARKSIKAIDKGRSFFWVLYSME